MQQIVPGCFCLLNRILNISKQALSTNVAAILSDLLYVRVWPPLKCPLIVAVNILEDTQHVNIWFKLLPPYFCRKALPVSPSPTCAQLDMTLFRQTMETSVTTGRLTNSWSATNHVSTHKHPSDPHCWALEPEKSYPIPCKGVKLGAFPELTISPSTTHRPTQAC